MENILRVLDREGQSLLYMIGKSMEAKSCKVFLLMLSLADAETGKVDTSLKDLHRRSGMAVTTIRRAITELCETGLLEVSHNVGVSTEYKLILSGDVKDKAVQIYEEDCKTSPK